MTAVLDRVPVELTPAQAEWMLPRPPRQRSARTWLIRLRTSVYPWLAVVAAVQVRNALHVKAVATPFEDEGLYVYFGHRMIDHYLHGSFVSDYPGAYFSGAPGLYPVWAAVGDYYGGLDGARDVSLIFAVIAMVGVCGIGTQLFGKVAGVIGAAAFSLNGSVIFLSHFATYDSAMMAFVALAAWLGIWSARRNSLLWSPVVAVLLMMAFLCKYAGAVYTPVVALLVTAIGWPKLRWFAVRQGLTLIALTAAASVALLGLVGRSLYPGISYTTLSRHTFSWVPVDQMLLETYHWVGAWMIAAAVALVVLVLMRRVTVAVAIALVIATVIVIAQQIRIHEAVSYSKHVCFGLMFASPIIGAGFAVLIDRRSWRLKSVGVLLVLLFGGYFLWPTGQQYARANLTFWPDDSALYPVVLKYHRMFPGTRILGESPSPERYELRYDTTESDWKTTYALSYHRTADGLVEHGRTAYRDALYDDYFGVVYLTSNTDYGSYVQNLINAGITDYRLRAKIPRTIRGKPAGTWMVYSLPLPGDAPR